MQTLAFVIDELQGGPGQTFKLGGSEVLLVCRGGETTFSQDDKGSEALRQHDFEHHERIKHYDWTELHGQEVTILVVQRIDPEDDIHQHLYGKRRVWTEMVARAKDGTYYFLPFDIGSAFSSYQTGEFKWKPQRDPGPLLESLSAPTPSDQGSRLLGSADTDE